MEAGKLRHRIDIESPEHSRDEDGNNVTVWEALYESVPAEIINTGGSETINGKQVQADASTKITIRYLPGISSRHRIKHNQQIWNITFVDNIDQRNRELVLTCKGDGQ